jgi:arylsulfatase
VLRAIQSSNQWGETRNGTIISWPNRIEERDGIRTQFAHVIDVVPTISAMAR